MAVDRLNLQKGPVELIKQVNTALSFLALSNLFPFFHFKLSYVVIRMAVKEFLGTHF